MRISLLSALVVVAILASIWGCNKDGPRNKKERPEMTIDQALKMIEEPTSELDDFNSAMEQLKFVHGSASFWLKVAGDAKQTPDRRRRCVRHFFDHFVSAGMRLDDLLRSIGVPVNWISIERINKLQEIFGYVPKEVLNGRSLFVIPILSDQKGDYRLTVLISLKEDVKLEDFAGALEGRPITEEVAKSVIAGCVPWDNSDDEKRHPGLKLQRSQH